MKVLAISGSLRRHSHNRKVLRAAAAFVLGYVESVLWDGLKMLPPYDEDDDIEPVPVAVAQLRGAIAGADALLISTPESTPSFPGQIRNAPDWASGRLATTLL